MELRRPLRGHEPGVAVRPVLGQDDRCRRMRLAERAHERLDALLDLGGRHVREAIEDVDGRIELGQKGRDLRLHHAVAREPEVDHRAIEPPAEDRRVDHARTRGAAPLRDRSPVEDDRLATVRLPAARAWRWSGLPGTPISSEETPL